MAITNARMQMKRGEEAYFDPDKMLPGEWAVSTDEKYVRMCFSPGVCVRMATYEAFEADMVQITAILEESKTVQEAVEKINLEIFNKLNAVIEYSEQTKQYRDEAEQFRNEAFSATPDGYENLVQNVTENTVKIDTIIEKAELNIKNTASGENIHLTDSANGKNVEFSLYGKAEQFVGTITDDEGNEISVPNPDYPQEITVSGSEGSVEVVSCGKNLLGEIQRYSIAGNPNSGYYKSHGESKSSFTAKLKPNTQYTFSKNEGVGDRFRYILTQIPFSDIPNYDVIIQIEDESNVLTFTTNSTYLYFTGYVDYSGSLTQEELNAQLEIGSYRTDYEPYKESTITVPTPDGLCGIKVSSGGNYTDENRQQWICDEIVKYADGSGKKIQRIGKVIIDGNNTFQKPVELTNVVRIVINLSNLGGGITKPSYCDRFLWDSSSGSYSKDYEHFYVGTTSLYLFLNKDRLDSIDASGVKAYFSANNTIVYYVLAEPIITDLTAEEIADIEKLYTFYPITNVFNDADCGMSITYLADSKLYIDNQLAIQKAQQEEALATMLLLMPEEVQASMIENDTNNLLNESEV